MTLTRTNREMASAAAIGVAVALSLAATACAQAPAESAAEVASPHAATTDYWALVFVLLLATFIGLGVIRRVSRLLYTPLMSLTNAISAIAVVGAILVAGEDYPLPIRVLGAIAIFASMTNIVSGFLITNRMLAMFKTTRPQDGKPT